MRVLVVDDEEIVRKLFQIMLDREGCEVLEAESGIIGLALLRTAGPVDAVLLDWDMPEMNGLAFLKLVRADPALAGIRVLVTTGDNDPKRAAQARDAGANGVLVKPLTARMLVEAIKKPC